MSFVKIDVNPGARPQSGIIVTPAFLAWLKRSLCFLTISLLPPKSMKCVCVSIAIFVNE